MYKLFFFIAFYSSFLMHGMTIPEGTGANSPELYQKALDKLAEIAANNPDRFKVLVQECFNESSSLTEIEQKVLRKHLILDPQQPGWLLVKEITSMVAPQVGR